MKSVENSIITGVSVIRQTEARTTYVDSSPFACHLFGDVKTIGYKCKWLLIRQNKLSNFYIAEEKYSFFLSDFIQALSPIKMFTTRAVKLT